MILRCSDCNVDYPYSSTFADCLACQEPTTPFNGVDPHPDWRERVAYAVNEVKRARQQAEVAGPVPVISVIVSERGGLLWIDSRAVINEGAGDLRTGQLIQIGQQVFEVNGYDSKRREYWIESFPPSTDLDDAALLLGARRDWLQLA